MFGIGSTEFLVIVLVALLVLGPRNLAKVSRTVGKYMGEFRRISTDFQRTLNAEVADEEREENREAIRQKVAKAKAARARRLQAEQKARDEQAAQSAGEATQASPETGSLADATTKARGQAQQDLHAAASQDMVQPPAGSPLEAMLKKTAQEAEAGDAPQASGRTQTGGQA